jgi:D-serine deaminase-like pyridoxal phosphate-dependent protein
MSAALRQVDLDALTGCSIFDEAVPTPFVYVDVDVMRANIARMAAVTERAGVGLRPHAKTHKTAEIAKLQLDAGAIGLTVAKLDEAAALIAAGVETSFMIAQPFAGRDKLRRCLELGAGRDILVCVDDVELAAALGAEAVAAGAEVDLVLIVDASEYDRFGVPLSEGEPTAQRIAELPGVRFRGIRSYPGVLYGISDDERATELAVADAQALAALAARLEERGLACDVVSTGNTPGTERLCAAGVPPGITELRPGNYVFADRMQIELGSVEPSATALHVVTTVVSASHDESRAIVDAGLKTLSGTQLDDPPGYGVIKDRPEVTLESLWEECGRVRVDGERLNVGDRLVVLPNHACELPNLAGVVLHGRDGRIDGAWIPVARGSVW